MAGFTFNHQTKNRKINGLGEGEWTVVAVGSRGRESWQDVRGAINPLLTRSRLTRTQFVMDTRLKQEFFDYNPSRKNANRDFKQRVVGHLQGGEYVKLGGEAEDSSMAAFHKALDYWSRGHSGRIEGDPIHEEFGIISEHHRFRWRINESKAENMFVSGISAGGIWLISEVLGRYQVGAAVATHIVSLELVDVDLLYSIV